MIQRPVQRYTEDAGEPRRPTVPVNVQQTITAPNLQTKESSGEYERDRKQERDPEENGYVINCIHENRPFAVNDLQTSVCEPLLRGGSVHTSNK